MLETLRPAAARLLGDTPAAYTLLAGGRNSRVYRADTAGASFALKVYFRHPDDPRDRLGTEIGALQFLEAQGVACVPRALAADAEAGLGLYEFIDGERPRDPGPAEVDQAAAFLVRLNQLRLVPAAARLSPASEARFSLRAVADNVQARLDALAAGAPDLASYLKAELIPAWNAVLERCRRGCARHRIAFERDLGRGERTLSPSDFGFHNALRRKGELVFLDFEYFGWDDPAKLVSDLLLHPGMDLASDLRIRLAEGILAGFQDPAAVRERVRLAYPLFGIKWCLILLNEFLPGHLDRRRFAQPGAGPPGKRQALQLAKTRQKLQMIRDDHDPFALAP